MTSSRVRADRARWRAPSTQGRGNMKRIKIIGIVAMLALVAAACSSGGDAEPAPTGTGGAATGATGATGRVVGVRGEHRCRPGVGRRRPSGPWSRRMRRAGTSSWLPSRGPTRISIKPPSTRRWSAGATRQCDTGTGGDVVMGYADGGGDTVNVWRAVSHMEAILQALTYPEIGTIVSTDGRFQPGSCGRRERHQVPDPRGVDFIVGYPDAGCGHRRCHQGSRRCGDPVRPVLGGLGRSSRSGRCPRSGSGLPDRGR